MEWNNIVTKGQLVGVDSGEGQNQVKTKRGRFGRGRGDAQKREEGKAEGRGEGWHGMACAVGVCGALGRGGVGGG